MDRGRTWNGGPANVARNGSWNRGDWDHDRHHGDWHHRRYGWNGGWFGFGWGYEPYAWDYGPDYYYGDYPYYYGNEEECYVQRRVVKTRSGHRYVRRIRVCD